MAASTRAARRGHGVKANVRVTAIDADGNDATEKAIVRLSEFIILQE